jgi:hypothetical protein
MRSNGKSRMKRNALLTLTALLLASLAEIYQEQTNEWFI